MGDQKSKFYFIVNPYQENGKTIVVYTYEELATLERLPGANREMSDEEITAAALADPDTASPLEDDIFLTGKRGRKALAELFPSKIVEGVLALRQGHPMPARPK